MKLVVALTLVLSMVCETDVVETDSGIVRRVEYVTHGEYHHTKVYFRITSSAEPIDIVIWLHNDEHRVKAGDHVRLDRSLWGDDDGPGVRPHTQCPDDPEKEPCVLYEIIGIKWLKDGEY